MERIKDLSFSTNRREAYRYMGYWGNTIPEDNVCQLVEECIAELEQAGAPRGIYRIDPLVFSSPEDFTLADFPVHSRALGKNLARCTQTALLAATLGAQVDLLIAKYSRLTISKAVIMQACAAAMIESYLDAAQEELRQYFLAEGLYLRPRFSPGFADFGTEYQRPLLSSLNATKLLGITLASDSNLMLPMKSVTAVIGAGPDKVRGILPED